MIRREDLADESPAQLVAALDAELLSLNPRLAEYPVGLASDDVDAGRGVFLVARIGMEPVGCGALTLIEPQVAEIKRMYVTPEHRSRGIAGCLLSALEAEARAVGATKVVLETAAHLTGAIALYRRAGYSEISQFGPYLGSDISVCMAKALDRD